jgi:hypothetical protein
MSALTERKKREIETQFRKMKARRAYKVFLYVLCDTKTLRDTFTIPQMIMDSTKRKKGVESIYYTNGTNVITVLAQWEDFEISGKIMEIKSIRHVTGVRTELLAPLF